jgi:hypothetical protein
VSSVEVRKGKKDGFGESHKKRNQNGQGTHTHTQRRWVGGTFAENAPNKTQVEQILIVVVNELLEADYASSGRMRAKCFSQIHPTVFV